MKKIPSFFLFTLFTLFTFLLQGQAPLAPSKSVTEEYCGITIEDRYRNLENLEDTNVKVWLKQQEKYAESVLERIPRRQYLIDEQKSFDEKRSASLLRVRITKNDDYFYLKRVASENIAKLFYRKGFSGKEELLYDPKDFKPEMGKTYVINYIQPDWNGERLIISLTENGKEISEMVIMDVKTRKLLPDLITNSWPSSGPGVSWLPDNSGFLYLHYPVIDATSNLFMKNTKTVCYMLGQNPTELNEVFSRSNNPEFNLKAQDFPVVTLLNEKDDYLFGEIAGATNYIDTYYAKSTKTTPQKYDWNFLFSKDEKIPLYTIEKGYLIYITGKNASNFRICKTPLDNPDFENPTVLVEEKKDEVIQNIVVNSNGLFFVTVRNGVEAGLYHFKDGVERKIELPKKSGYCSIVIKGENYPELWVSIMGWSSYYRRYKYDSDTDTFENANLTPIVDFPELEDIVVKEVLVKSHDGAEVPLSIVYKKGLELNGKNPVIIYGLGAYGGSVSPRFNYNNILFNLEGGIYAIAHVRGGGEKGVAWHQGGKKETKPNTWKDLIACTEYLIEKKYTSNKHTAIWSFSSGGILVGRAMTERPDLFAVAIPEVGIMNAMRFEKAPNGKNNIKEFGTLENPEECKALYEMDAYLHIKKGVDYPATLITAGVNDPRVIVWQPAKFAAKLQAAQGSDKPVLFLVNHESGHDEGGARLKYYESHANVIAFTLWQTGHPNYQISTDDFSKK